MTQKSPTFRCFLYLDVQYSGPHCIWKYFKLLSSLKTCFLFNLKYTNKTSCLQIHQRDRRTEFRYVSALSDCLDRSRERQDNFSDVRLICC